MIKRYLNPSIIFTIYHFLDHSKLEKIAVCIRNKSNNRVLHW